MILGPYLDTPPKRPETWVALSPSLLKVLGGTPDVVVLNEGVEYRHTSDGRLWKRVR